MSIISILIDLVWVYFVFSVIRCVYEANRRAKANAILEQEKYDLWYASIGRRTHGVDLELK